MLVRGPLSPCGGERLSYVFAFAQSDPITKSNIVYDDLLLLTVEPDDIVLQPEASL